MIWKFYIKGWDEWMAKKKMLKQTTVFVYLIYYIRSVDAILKVLSLWHWWKCLSVGWSVGYGRWYAYIYLLLGLTFCYFDYYMVKRIKFQLVLMTVLQKQLNVFWNNFLLLARCLSLQMIFYLVLGFEFYS